VRDEALPRLAASAEVAHAVCFGCGALASEGNKLAPCAGCATARFCGKECLRKAWKSFHKANCARFRESAS